VAFSWFNKTLEINPYYQPAIKELSDIANQVKESAKEASQPEKTRAKAATKTKK
jgi:hypothetical protein